MISTTKPKQTTDLDRAVGSRVAALRAAKGLSQTAVANSLGISFQQVQKYEKGKNRMGAGRLHEIAAILGVPVSVLFDVESPEATQRDETLSVFQVEGTASLVKAYVSIESEEVRRDVLSLVRTAARLEAGRRAASATG